MALTLLATLVLTLAAAIAGVVLLTRARSLAHRERTMLAFALLAILALGLGTKAASFALTAQSTIAWIFLAIEGALLLVVLGAGLYGFTRMLRRAEAP